MDFLKSSKRRTLVSEIAYYGLNIGLAAALLVVVFAIESPLPAFAIVLLSKWRVLAVRPRYWASNIKANIVDTIVGLSIVVLLYAASGALIAQIILTMLYIVWLLVIKPRSKRMFVAAQAGIAVFLGVSALMTISYSWASSAVVLLMWIIGYSAARHLQTTYEEPHRSFYSFAWGLVLAEIGWLGYHWNFAYDLPGLGNLKLSQTALVALVFCFLGERIYSSYRRYNTIRSSDVLLPIVFSIGIVLTIMLFFNTFDGTV
jgi:hypothetical protein